MLVTSDAIGWKIKKRMYIINAPRWRREVKFFSCLEGNNYSPYLGSFEVDAK